MKQLPRQQRQQQRQQQKVQLRPLKRRPKLLLISQKPTTNFKLEKRNLCEKINIKPKYLRISIKN